MHSLKFSNQIIFLDHKTRRNLWIVDRFPCIFYSSLSLVNDNLACLRFLDLINFRPEEAVNLHY
jgi:hypothetical protein